MLTRNYSCQARFPCRMESKKFISVSDALRDSSVFNIIARRVGASSAISAISELESSRELDRYVLCQKSVKSATLTRSLLSTRITHLSLAGFSLDLAVSCVTQY